MVERSKPDRRSSCAAAEEIGTIPAETVVLEDSYNGIRAAHAGGFIACMVPDLREPRRGNFRAFDAAVRHACGCDPVFRREYSERMILEGTHEWIKQEVNVHNEAGLHARPANVFVKTAAQFPCNVRISKGGKLFNGKSMVSVLSACVKCDTMIEVICDGEREEEALAAIVQAVESGLGE